MLEFHRSSETGRKRKTDNECECAETQSQFSSNYHALPGTADSLREALSACFTLANGRQKTDLGRCTRARLANQPTSCSLFIENKLMFDPVHDPCNLLITYDIFLESVKIRDTNRLPHIACCVDSYMKVTFTSSNTTCSLLSWHTCSPIFTTNPVAFLSFQCHSSPPKLRLHMFISGCQTVNKRLAAVAVSLPTP